MSFTKVWIHAVWATKNQALVLVKEQRHSLFNHIKDYARGKEIFILCINGHADHVHCLFSLHVEISLAKTMQLLKGESAHWANQQKLVLPKLEWADEYFAASLSESVLEKCESLHQQPGGASPENDVCRRVRNVHGKNRNEEVMMIVVPAYAKHLACRYDE